MLNTDIKNFKQLLAKAVAKKAIKVGTACSVQDEGADAGTRAIGRNSNESWWNAEDRNRLLAAFNSIEQVSL